MNPIPAQHLYLSPHLDDAALSCGGTIHAQAGRGEGVRVLTVCAGGPPKGRLSDYAYGLHERWGQPRSVAKRMAAEMVEARRAEDRAALAILGAEARFLDVPDVIYRRMGPESVGDIDRRERSEPDEIELGETERQAQRWTVESDAGLFRGFEPREAALLDATAERIEAEIQRIVDDVGILRVATEAGIDADIVPDAADANAIRLYLPLAAGDHVDHHLVRRAAERVLERRPDLRLRVAYYEDYPYAEDPRAVASALGDREAWRAEIVPLGEADLDAKVAAIACYASQISSFWDGLAEMEAAVRNMARRVASDSAIDTAGRHRFAERFWQRR